MNSGRFRGWSVVAGTALVIGFGGQAFLATGFTLLASALIPETGWPAPGIALGATLFLLSQMLAYPLIGGLIDRLGPRRVATLGFVLFGLGLWATSQASSLGQFQFAMLVLGFVSTMTNPITYLRALSLWFDRRRGLAMGLAAGGMSLGAVLIPLGMFRAIEQHGWDAGLQLLAAVHLLFCLPVVLWLLHDDPRRFGQRADGEPRAAPAVREVDTAEALRTPSLYLLALVYAASGMAVFGVLVNSAQVLTQGAGLSMANIASAQAVAGASVLLGRVLVGYLLDRFPARLLGAIVTLVTAAAVLGYANATTPAFALLSAMLLGFGIGGETDVMPYMAARYFGTRSLGTLLGLLGAAFTLGAAISPLAFSWMASASGTVTLPLYVFASITAISALAFWAMPPLPAPAPGSLAA